jgi:hypothetical protein
MDPDAGMSPEQAPVTGHPRVAAALSHVASGGDAPGALIAAVMEADGVLREVLETVAED